MVLGGGVSCRACRDSPTLSESCSPSAELRGLRLASPWLPSMRQPWQGPEQPVLLPAPRSSQDRPSCTFPEALRPGCRSVHRRGLPCFSTLDTGHDRVKLQDTTEESTDTCFVPTQTSSKTRHARRQIEQNAGRGTDGSDG